MNKYSVLMSVYIKEKPQYLRKSIESMLTQTLKPDEIILVKDGKLTIELNQVIDYFITKFPQIIKVIGYDDNKGLGFALNYGLKYCKNEIVARMDTDDLSFPNRLEKEIQILNETNADIVGADIQEFNGEVENACGKRLLPTSNEDIIEYMKTRCPFNHMTVVFKKSKVLEAGGYLDWFSNEDYYLWLRMYLNGSKFANTGTVLVNVRVDDEMYQRRGGIKYFSSEYKLQKFMLRNKIINFSLFCSNVMKRFIVQVLLPNKIRGFVFKKFARN